MVAITIFLMVFISSLFAGSVLAYPLFILVSLATDVNYSNIIILSTQLTGLTGSLLYLKYSDNVGFKSLGYLASKADLKRHGIIAFSSGLIIVLLLGLSLYFAEVYDINSQREFLLRSLLKLIISAIGTGVLVALFEETVFRGALLQGLYKQSSVTVSIFLTSLVYAWVHFIYFELPTDPGTINLFTAPANFVSAYTEFLSLQKTEAFVSLFILGILLGIIRIKQGNIIACIGLHAGLVAGIKIFRYMLEYQPENPYPFLVSSHDYRLGFVATFWLFIATLMYYFFSYRNMNEGK